MNETVCRERARAILAALAVVIVAMLAQGTEATIQVPSGFEVSVLADSLTTPTDLDMDGDGNLFVAAGGGGSDPLPVLMITPQAQVVESDPIADPDGIAVGEAGTVFVAGADEILTVQFPSGTVWTHDPCFENLDSIEADAGGSVFAGEDNGDLLLSTTGCGGDPVLASVPPGNGIQAILTDEDTGDLYFGGLFTEVLRLRGAAVDTVSNGVHRVGDLAWGPGGIFGQDLYVAEGSYLRVSRVDPLTGAVSTFATFEYDVEAPDGLAFPDQETMYVSQPRLGRILRIRFEGTSVPEPSVLWTTWGRAKARFLQ
jgi:hypothetical protein